MVSRIFSSSYLTGLVRCSRMQIKLDDHIGLDAVNSIQTQVDSFKKGMKEAILLRAIDNAVRITWMMGSHDPEREIISENIPINVTPPL